MKKTLLILLAALVCLSGTACRKKDADETTKAGKTSAAVPSDRVGNTSTPTATAATPIVTTAPIPTDPTPKPNDSDTPIFSESEISVYFRSITNDFGSKNVHLFVTNSADRTVSVNLQLMTVNRYAIQYPESIDLIPQSAANMVFEVSNSQLEAVGITDLSQITEITVQISARDANLDRLFDDQLITFRVK